MTTIEQRYSPINININSSFLVTYHPCLRQQRRRRLLYPHPRTRQCLCVLVMVAMVSVCVAREVGCKIKLVFVLCSCVLRGGFICFCSHFLVGGEEKNTHTRKE